MQFPNDFQQRIALAWAASCLAKFDAENPNASEDDRMKAFTEAIEGGLFIALQITKG